MDNTKTTPIWVTLAFSSINTRKGALLLITSCALFTLYCIPWPLLFPGIDWIEFLFQIEDWSWFAMMTPMVFWYLISLKWMDNNCGWEYAKKDSDNQQNI
ncbi:MAG: hypothetical protein GY814_03850 [Gammaproteobacteria bacterium]|nr:hypothetical protein [Gammaproteobacteria bacterium]